MEQEANSWIRRTKFSHTIYHRFDSAKLASVPLSIELEQYAGLKSRSRKTEQVSSSSSSNVLKSSTTSLTKLQRNPVTHKLRSVSPNPQTILSDEFKEAQSSKKRFSTPAPQRRNNSGSGKGVLNKNYLSSSMKFYDKMMSRKDSSWMKYFDHGGGRVTSVETADELMVDLSQLYFGPKFAFGANSQLYQGIYKDEPVAVKIIKVPNDVDDDDDNGALSAKLEKQFNREVTFLSRLRHENVVKFVAAWRKAPAYCIITEYLSEGSLRAYLHKLEQEHIRLPLKKLIGIALDIARGMEYIHSRGVVHRDLKPENILINKDFRMKIADFGIACEESSCDLFSDDPGTYRWMAPEMIKRKAYGRKVDVYSFGLILWEMVAGKIPYSDMTPIQAAFAVVNKKLRPEIPEKCCGTLRGLIEQCWSSKPEKRPEFWQIGKVLGKLEFDCSNKIDDGDDDKKGGRRGFWMQKIGSSNVYSNNMPMPKPRFT
ncbi:serine/threonine/tyrosine-protein kinase HT1-like [Impatiens glandulifera]|uniref:serine/threonine/tyrosine-protein kinase HT1-like n=1 Tax=Impatiens glandulifera TaxID=253017 RepID=UPI001FB10160|nr:serine/threonine/tyrosine-protein kinase HT1-like [Impatiens glandulifera]XP_047326980.1 serine/threonine/tyrosine-protein kinase HT1-like [Impatiens glandulifera]XP_047326981.1 serine/threonine/tyrosine-protein kinase HT1-like [Impatiens glandulifera]